MHFLPEAVIDLCGGKTSLPLLRQLEPVLSSHLARGGYLGIGALGSPRTERWHPAPFCPVSSPACGRWYSFTPSSALPSQPPPAEFVHGLTMEAPSAILLRAPKALALTVK